MGISLRDALQKAGLKSTGTDKKRNDERQKRPTVIRPQSKAGKSPSITPKKNPPKIMPVKKAEGSEEGKKNEAAMLAKEGTEKTADNKQVQKLSFKMENALAPGERHSTARNAPIHIGADISPRLMAAAKEEMRYQQGMKPAPHHGQKNTCGVCRQMTPDVEYYEHPLKRVLAHWICCQCADKLKISDTGRLTNQSDLSRKRMFKREYGATKRYGFLSMDELYEKINNSRLKIEKGSKDSDVSG